MELCSYPSLSFSSVSRISTVSKLMEKDAARAIILFNSGREKSSCLIGPMVKVILETVNKFHSSNSF